MPSHYGFLEQRRPAMAAVPQPNFLEMRQAPISPQVVVPDSLKHRYLGDPDQQESTVVPDWRGGGVAIEKPGGGYYTPEEWASRTQEIISQPPPSQPAPGRGPNPRMQQRITPDVTPMTPTSNFLDMRRREIIPTTWGQDQTRTSYGPPIVPWGQAQTHRQLPQYNISGGPAPTDRFGNLEDGTPGGPASTPEGRLALKQVFPTFAPAGIGEGVGGGGGYGDEIPPGTPGYQWKPEEIVAALWNGVDVVDGRDLGGGLYGLNGEIRAVGLTDKRLFQFGPNTAIYEGVDWYFNSDGVLVPGNFLHVSPDFFDPPVGRTGPQFTARGGGGPAPPFGFAQGALQGISPVIPTVDAPAAIPNRFGPIDLNRSFLDLPEAALASLPPEQLARLAPFLEAQGFSGIGNVGQFGERTYEHAALPGDISTLFTQAQIDLISDPQFKSWMQYLLGELGIFGSRVPVPTNAT